MRTCVTIHGQVGKVKPSRVTMRQVATEAGVAVMTVSYTYTRPERVAAATRTRVLEHVEREEGRRWLGGRARAGEPAL